MAIFEIFRDVRDIEVGSSLLHIHKTHKKDRADKTQYESGSEKGVFLKRGLFRKVHYLEILENLEILEKPKTLEDKGESDHFLENLEIPEIPPAKRLLS